MQKSNLLRVTMNTKYATIDPRNLTIVEQGDMKHYRDIQREEMKPPLDVQYGLSPVDLGKPGDYKGNFRSYKAATLW